ncbi:hypothetical protein [Thioalkalivibrio sp. ARh3]|uniref:hypothetical protein n=1 Tax=Thioalkalivibrio sp. ARh3 TaxID=1158148 RepID=UPI000477669F|nr:hypothetical protein [Thioalkalivibrio sp. ARh3]
MKRWKKLASGLALAAAIISSSGCATTEYVYVAEPLPLPDRPALPRIAASDLECLTDEAYERLVERDALQDTHIERLKAIIESTHQPGESEGRFQIWRP